jgi:hypothetical protein
MLQVRAAKVVRHLGGPTRSCYHYLMRKAISDNANRRGPGRPPTTGRGTLVGVRILAPVLSRLDAWVSEQPDMPSRPEAIRRLMELGLSAPAPKQKGK